MTRVAVAGESDPELVAAIAVAGHEVVEPGACEVLVVALTPEGPGLTERPAVPCVAVIGRRADDVARRVFDETARSTLETRADAYVLGARDIADAIRWVTSEDRGARSTGPPRLVVVGTSRDDFGATRPIRAEPMILGRAMSFGQHPQRPDAMPTPVGSIARWHARVRNIDGALAIADMGSTNGTLVLRRGQPARLLCPQQAGSGREFGPPASPWLVRDPAVEDERQTGAWTTLEIGDEVQLPGFWRFRIDGDAAWRPDD
jgi:hypothetical protein